MLRDYKQYTFFFLILLPGLINLFLPIAHDHSKGLWLPSGFALGLVLIRGYSTLGLIFVAGTILGYVEHGGLSMSLLQGLSLTAESGLGAIFILSPKWKLSFAKLRHLLWFFFSGCLLAPLVATWMEASFHQLYLDHHQNNEYLIHFFDLFATHSLGILLITPMIITFQRGLGRFDWPHRLTRDGLFLILASTATILILWTNLPQFMPQLPLVFILFPFVLIGSYHYGQFGALIYQSIVLVLVYLLTYLGHGPFVGTEDYAYHELQNFFAILGVSSLVISLYQDQSYLFQNVLADTNRALQASMQVGQVGIWRFLENRIEWDEKCAQITGLTKHPPGSTQEFLSRIHPEDQAWVDSTVTEAMKSGEFPKITFRITGDDQNTRWILSQAQPVYSDLGKLRGFIGSSVDITEQKKIQEELLIFKEAANSAIDAIILCDKGGHVSFFNPAAEILLGYQEKDVLSKPIELFFPHSEEEQELFAKVYGHRGWSGQIIMEGKGHYRFPVALSASSIEGEEGKRLGTIFVITDITEMKAVEDALIHAKERAEEATAMKSEFLANMSHEIRTPMNAILGFSDLLLETTQDETQKKHLNSIRGAGKSLLTLINDILDLSKIEAGKMTLLYEMVPFRPFIEEIYHLFTHKAKEQGLHFELYLDPSLPPLLRVDEARIRQILVNLLGNAFKFTNKGMVGLKVTQEKSAIPNHVELKLIVEDTGIGITEEAIDIIFDFFQQAEGCSHKQFGGTGLGLAICKKLVTMMNGEITLDSQVGVGSRFVVRLPQVEYKSGNVPRTPGRPNGNLAMNLEFQEATLLVVDDVEINRLLIKEYCENTPLHVIMAHDGLEAVEQTKLHKPDLVLMDLKMPHLSGYEATKKIKADPELAEIPIIALSASSQEVSKAKIKKTGFKDFLRKPITKNELFLTLSSYLDHGVTITPELDEEPTQGPATIDQEELKRIRPHARELKELYQNVTHDKIFRKVKDFANIIMDTARQIKAHGLHALGNALLQGAENFDPIAIDRELEKFEELLSQLKHTPHNP